MTKKSDELQRTPSGRPIFESYKKMGKEGKAPGLDKLTNNPSTVTGVGEAQLRRIHKKVERQALQDLRNEVVQPLIKNQGSMPMATTISLQDPSSLTYESLDVREDGLPRKVKVSAPNPLNPKKRLSRTYDVNKVAPGLLPGED